MRMIVLLLLVVAGCSRTVEVSVIDIETRQPIPHATVRTRYNIFLGDFFPPKSREFVADSSGVVKVKVATGWEKRCHLTPAAEGYERGFYMTPAGSSIQPMSSDGVIEGPKMDIHWIRNGKPFPKTLVAELWKSPSPVFTVIVPDGYRGPLKLQMDPYTVHDLALGERTVVTHADSEGFVSLPLTRPIFFSYSTEEPIYRFASGEEIPKTFPVRTRANVVIRGKPATTPVVADEATAIRQIRGGYVVVGDAALAKQTTIPPATRPAQ